MAKDKLANIRLIYGAMIKKTNKIRYAFLKYHGFINRP